MSEKTDLILTIIPVILLIVLIVGDYYIDYPEGLRLAGLVLYAILTLIILIIKLKNRKENK